MNEWQKILGASPDSEVRAGWRELCRFGQSPASIRAQFFSAAPVYLATPYSKEVIDAEGNLSLALAEKQVELATWESLVLTCYGFTVISPIVLSGGMINLRYRPEASSLPHPLDGKAWANWCKPLLYACRIVVVPDLPGAIRSAGVLHEVRQAIKRNKIVYFYEQ